MDSTSVVSEVSPVANGASSSTILLLVKIGSMIVLGIGSLVLGMLPLLIGRCRERKSLTQRKVMSSVPSANNSAASTLTVDTHQYAETAQQGLLTSLLLCFGGGVLLFTTFLHLAPEVHESVAYHQSTHQLVDLGSLSLAELLFCCGFFLVYLVEETVHAALTSKPDSTESLLYRTVSVRRCNNNNSSSNNNNNNGSNNKSNGSTTCSSASSQPRNSLTVVQPRNSWRPEAENDEDGHETKSAFVLSPHALEESRAKVVAKAQQQQQPHQHHSHHHHHHASNSMKSLLTVLALSFHAIFEGLAVGLEPAFMSVVYLAGAIATHKLVISFCVGMELYVAGASKRTILGYLSVFSMVTPLGIALGLALGHFRNDSETLGPTPTILQGMAAGTLLYVVFFEVLARERANEKSGLLQLAAIIVGFMLMLGLQLASASAHSHDHGHSHAGHGH
ncbi:protein zntC-like isoform X1 [Trichogramma pretiosum]|uniref:protein zntC-like isoform X1 n=1 Tax=Trichogramma pretiosum TaxID=7493 RepID=UPI0006C9C716|nr:protein zntC-like isoform X1 [Trichogramma pretiosum]XP_014236651.1 protein zntC-like isoform X1 [Trichogramma pretiosum]XP_014236652.1 protein zntC-like isoform X1 [Trichogramma pretiosum]XP_014236653.1 protein zntC-like isoform X1 [Trichogramma pretiosum]XP_014236654.1 protein zntC-like isoform X1 [Trichogramma pretiosum]XP_023315830.1 protein zntC-like isoform X1 [Trichogramma pretiosum]